MSVAVIRGDARSLPLVDESVHLVVTSPPYNAGLAYDGYGDRLPSSEYWDGLIAPFLRESFRVLVRGGRLCVNFANVIRIDAPQPGRNGRTTQYQGRTTARAADGPSWPVLVVTKLWAEIERAGFLPREQITWLKADRADHLTVTNNSTAWGSWCSASNPVLRAVAEPVLIAVKGSHSRESGRSDLTPDEFKAWTRNAWYISSGHRDQTLGHPAIFPLELPRRLIKLYSYVGDTVLDPFAGSGTTLRAAINVGRRAIGVEQSPRYAAMARDRCAQRLLFSEAAS